MSALYRVGVVIPAGGRGTRFGADIPKQYLELCGIPILVRSVQTALLVDGLCSLVIAVQPAEIEHVRTLLSTHQCSDSRVHVTAGGAERHLSVAKGLMHPSLDEANIVLIHDAVRPLASVALFNAVAHAAHMHGAAIPVISVTDTLKRVDDGGVVIETVDRSSMRRAQTPQGFTQERIRAIYATAIERGISATDCSSLCEQADVVVHTIVGEEHNIKITTPFDRALASLLLDKNLL
jgi:2-C-methyl-D-erythritol 4-phosphate cytidylyltransferase